MAAAEIAVDASGHISANGTGAVFIRHMHVLLLFEELAGALGPRPVPASLRLGVPAREGPLFLVRARLRIDSRDGYGTYSFLGLTRLDYPTPQ